MSEPLRNVLQETVYPIDLDSAARHKIECLLDIHWDADIKPYLSDPESASAFSLEGLVTTASVKEVYDGDTYICCFPVRGKYSLWRCRLLGVNCPEIRTKDLQEKQAGRDATNRVRERIEGQQVTIRCDKFDSFGRVLAQITHEGEDLAEWLLREKLAVADIR